MSVKFWFLGLVVVSTLAVTNSQLRQAIAFIQGGNGRIQGNITFSQNDGGTVTIWGKIQGLQPGRHGFHVHETGDITSGCSSTGAHYNPLRANHGGLTDHERHIGDLGNIMASQDGVALVSISDNVISLTGPYMIFGRTVVIHADPDDMAKGGFSDSLKTGHAGSRVACGVIGLLTPLRQLYQDQYISSGSVSTLQAQKILLLPLLAVFRLFY